MTANLRLATAADAAILAELHRQCFDPPWREGFFANLIADASGFALLATMGISSRPDAFAAARVAADEGEILSLGTLPEARRHGLARLLLGRIIHETGLRGGRRLFLEVAEDNLAARELYGFFGFSMVGVRNAYYSSPAKPTVAALMFRLDVPVSG